MTESTGSLTTTDHALPEVRAAIRATHSYLFSIQHEDGHWCGELEGDTILESEFILVMHFIGQTDSPKVGKAAEYIRRQQGHDGGWPTYPGGPADVSVSAKAYFVLKLVGDDPDAPHMVRARERILECGGLGACNSFTMIQLAVFGQYDWAACPMIPPEIILFPRWFPINLYEMSSWSRAMLVPLSIVSANRPVCPIPEHATIEELHTEHRPTGSSAWARVFLMMDRVAKLVERVPVKPGRKVALRRAEAWIAERMEGSDGVGAIFPGIVNNIYALKVLGYDDQHPLMQTLMRELDRLFIEDEETLRLQPCFSPTWDTSLAVNALIESGLPADDPKLRQAAAWLLGKRGHENGDWCRKVESDVPAGFFFEYANPFYPDCDTTAQTIVALKKIDHAPDVRDDVARAIEEARQWHASMQNEDGGWAAFDRGCDREMLTHMPFADHNAMIDPSTADLTARGLEQMAEFGVQGDDPAADRAIRYLLAEQEGDGSWFGRWGCNYIYGTWLAAWGLTAMGLDPREAWGQRAGEWLMNVQNADGGWGESMASYDDPSLKGCGESTASQTAWALLGLMSLGELETEAVRRGVDYLLSTQRPDGSWYDEAWTGTGFPRVFYLRYHLYPIYFPLLALGVYAAGGPKLRGLGSE